jgi:hypothetical protein
MKEIIHNFFVLSIFMFYLFCWAVTGIIILGSVYLTIGGIV